MSESVSTQPAASTGSSDLSLKRIPNDLSSESHSDSLEVTDAARVLIKALREHFPELQPTSPLYIRFDDAYLNRFVIARRFQLDEVMLMVKDHLEWFKEFDVSSIADFKYTELEQFRAVYPHGYHGVDKIGRPIYIERYSKLNADYIHSITTMERLSKYWVQGYERLLYERFPACPKSGNRSCVILDMSSVRLGMFDSRAREFLKTVSKISSDNYPETLGILFVVNVPSFFSVLYSIAKPMIPAETKRKIHVVNGKHTKEELLKHIDASQLPSFLGGECRCDLSGRSPTNAADTGDHGCLRSDRGPWHINHRNSTSDFEDFVSCSDGEIMDMHSFHPHVFFDAIEEEQQPRKKPWWAIFTCGTCKPDII